MKVQAVIFTLFGTLVNRYSLKASNDNLKMVASVLSIPHNDLLNMWEETFNNRMKGEFKNSQACLSYICQSLKVPVHEDQIEIAAGIHQYMTIKEVTNLRTGALEILSYLKSKGFHTGLISNCPLEVIKIWEETPLAPLVDVTAFSCVEGAVKPDPYIYQAVSKKLGVSPERCLFIADGTNRELEGALKAGMQAVMLRTDAEKDRDLPREEWTGKVITSFQELPAFLEIDT